MIARALGLLFALPVAGCATTPSPGGDGVLAAALRDAQRRWPSVEWDSRDTVAADLDCDGAIDAALVGDDGVAYRAAFALRRGSGFEWHQETFDAESECAFPDEIDAEVLEKADVTRIRETLPEFPLEAGCAVVHLHRCPHVWYFGAGGMRKTQDPRIISCIHG